MASGEASIARVCWKLQQPACGCLEEGSRERKGKQKDGFNKEQDEDYNKLDAKMEDATTWKCRGRAVKSTEFKLWCF